MSVDGPGIGPLRPGGEAPEASSRAHPQAEGAIDVQPGSAGRGHVGDVTESVESTGVDLPGLTDDDRRPLMGRERLAQCAGIEDTLVVGSDVGDVAFTEAEIPQRRKVRRVGRVTDEYPDVRRPLQSVTTEIVAGAGQHLAPGRGKTDKRSHGRPGGESDRAFFGQFQQFQKPAARDLLGDGCGGRSLIDAGVLPPGGRQPIGGNSHGMRAAHHPGEKPRIDITHEARFRRPDEIVDDLGAGPAPVGKTDIERRPQIVGIRGGVQRMSGGPKPPAVLRRAGERAGAVGVPVFLAHRGCSHLGRKL